MFFVVKIYGQFLHRSSHFHIAQEGFSVKYSLMLTGHKNLSLLAVI